MPKQTSEELIESLKLKLGNCHARIRELELLVSRPSDVQISLNENGTHQISGSAKASEWCRLHKRGIIIGIGVCEAELWQHVHHLSHAEVLAAKKAYHDSKGE